MAGIIQGDQLEIFHVLRPGIRMGGRVTEAYQLHSLAVVDEGEGWSKLHEVLNSLYQVSVYVHMPTGQGSVNNM